MYGGSHTLRNVFSSDLEIVKSIFFWSTSTMVDSGNNYAMKFLFSRAVTLIAIALGKFESPVASVIFRSNLLKIESIDFCFRDFFMWRFMQ